MARVARRLVILGLLAFLTALPSLPTVRNVQWRAAGTAWARGPVWYIMTVAEYTAYRWQRTEQARHDFIREFWSRRDPIPDTATNELENEFWRRVDVADDHFGQDIKPGWKTERGKVFIMLGPPDNMERDGILADVWGSRGWLYDLSSMPTHLRIVLQDNLKIPSDRRIVKLKVRAETEGSRSVQSGTALDRSVLRPTDFLPLAEALVRRISGPDALRDLGHIMRVPEVLDLERARVNVTSVFSMIPVQARIDFRPTGADAEKGDTAVAVTIGVPRSTLAAEGVTSFDEGAAIVVGQLSSVENERTTCRLSGSFDPTGTESADESLVFQALCRVPPGRYLLDASFQDTRERVMGSVRDLIEVPSFDPSGLRISSLILSTKLDKLESGVTRPDHADAPFMFGSYRVVPRTSQIFNPAETLKVFCEVYGAGAGADGRVHLDVTYQFYVQDGGSWLPVGAPFTLEDEEDAAQAWAVPLAGWPAGRYRLELLATDRLSGSSVVRGALFEVDPAATR